MAVGNALDKGLKRAKSGVQRIEAVRKTELLDVYMLVDVELVDVFVKNRLELRHAKEVLKNVEPVVKNLLVCG